MQDQISVGRRTLGLYLRIAIILVPSFLIVSAAGLSVISHDRVRDARESMALKIGNAQARVGAALERYSDRSDWPVDWSRPLVGELLNTLLSNPAVTCAFLITDDEARRNLATVPAGLGCTGRRVDAQSEIDLYTEPPTLLVVRYHEAELDAARRAQREFSTLILGGGLAVAMMTSWLAFRIVVGRPLRVLLSQIEASRDVAQRASRIKSDFMAKMSHELRTPLNAIIGSVELLTDSRQGQTDDQEQIDLINRASTDLLAMITDILDVAALDRGEVVLERSALDPVLLLRDIARAAGDGFASKGIRFDHDTDMRAGVKVYGDPIRIRQVLMKILDNARKFTDSGRVGIRLTRSGDDSLRFVITDTGPGIAPERVAHLFTAFEQADNDRSRAFDGAGLGLTISQKVIEAMGGSLDISSEPGRGTVVTVTLPAPQAEPGPSQPQTPAGAMNIMVVEDNAANRRVMQAFLKKTPHRVCFAENGAAAVEKARDQVPDLVFMDISMPVMDGCTATRRIRDEERLDGRAPARIIALTANSGIADQKMALDAGMDGFLTKPVRRVVIDGAIAEAARLRHPTSQSDRPGNATRTITRTRSDTTKGATPA